MLIRTKLLLTFILVITLITITTWLTYRATLRVQHYRDHSVISERRLIAATGLRAQVRNRFVDIYEILFIRGLPGNEKVLAIAKRSIEEKFERFEEVSKEDLEHSAELHRDLGRTHLIEIERLRTVYQKLDLALDHVILLHEKGSNTVKPVLLDVRENLFNKAFIKEITQVIDDEAEDARVGGSLLQQSITALTRWLVAMALLGAAIATVLTVYVSNSVARRLTLLGSATQKVAAGDLSVVLPENGSDEISILAYAFNLMTASLRNSKEQLTKQQEALVATSKMSALGEMAGGMAHEINNPLALIQVRASQLKELADSKELDLPTISELSQEIEATALRISKIVKGLRTFVRDESRDPFEIASIQSIVRETLEFCRDRVKQQGVRLDITMPDTELKAECRSTQISQVILNLVGNAIDAIQTLTEKWIRVSVSERQDMIEIAVVDSGGGIPKNVREKLMQPFFTTKEIGKGTGLGLSISRGLIAAHHGNLFLDTGSANTRFVIELPRTQAAKLT